MYAGGYPQTKFTLDAKKMQKSKGKSCGYYWRIIFLFSSLIQSLIIVSLVLFMVYGHPEQSSEEKRVQDLQSSFTKLTGENKRLEQQGRNLSRLLNATLSRKQRDDLELLRLRRLANVSSNTILNFNNKLYTCEMEKRNVQKTVVPSTACTNTPTSTNPSSSSRITQLQAMHRLLDVNFTQTVQHLSRELEQANRARDGLTLEAIGLRRNASDLQRQLDAYSRKCKGDFVQSLDGIQTVTRAFIGRIDGLFHAEFPFQLTCEKQREQLEQIRSNCSSLSREVETKFQGYLNRVGERVSRIQAQSSLQETQSGRLQEDLRWCAQNRTAEAALGRRRSQEAQGRFDREVERLLKEQSRLRSERELQEHAITVKTSEINILTNQLLRLNMTLRNCIPKPGQLPVQYPPGGSYPGLPRPGTGGTGGSYPGLPRPGTGGTGGSYPGATRPGTGGTGGSYPGATRPGTGGTGGTGMNPPWMNVPGTSSGFNLDLQKHLKELQEVIRDSGVSG